jgi:hypothetical protein
MKSYDNHNYRSGISLRIELGKPTEYRNSLLLCERLEILERFADSIGASLDYNLALMNGRDGPNVCLVAEHERTRTPGRHRDPSYRCFRDNAQAVSYLAGKLILIRHLAEALELDVESHGFYHETL